MDCFSLAVSWKRINHHPKLNALLKSAVAARWHGAPVRDGLRDGLCPFPHSPETRHLLN